MIVSYNIHLPYSIKPITSYFSLDLTVDSMLIFWLAPFQKLALPSSGAFLLKFNAYKGPGIFLHYLSTFQRKIWNNPTFFISLLLSPLLFSFASKEYFCTLLIFFFFDTNYPKKGVVLIFPVFSFKLLSIQMVHSV